MKYARTSTRGFALIEALAAAMIMGVVLLALLDVRNQSIRWFTMSGDQYTAAWLADMKMNEILSQQLPDPSEEETIGTPTAENGDFAYLDDRANEVNRARNEGWKDRAYFAKFTWSWKKEIIFIGPEFIGTQAELDAWTAELDDEGNPIGDDPHTKPAARIIRVTLEIVRPLPRKESEDGVEESDDELVKRSTLKLVTYVDPASLLAGKKQDPATNPPTPPPTG